MSSNGFIELKDKESLEKFISDSHQQPSILFKHSSTCGISAMAHREMSKLQQQIGLIIVQRSRDLSNEVERRYAVSHETPQVLIVRGEQLLWDASHGRVRAQAVAAALESVSNHAEQHD